MGTVYHSTLLNVKYVGSNESCAEITLGYVSRGMHDSHSCIAALLIWSFKKKKLPSPFIVMMHTHRRPLLCRPEGRCIINAATLSNWSHEATDMQVGRWRRIDVPLFLQLLKMFFQTFKHRWLNLGQKWPLVVYCSIQTFFRKGHNIYLTFGAGWTRQGSGSDT